MVAVVIRSKRLPKATGPALCKRSIARAGWVTGFALVMGVAVATAIAGHKMSSKRVPPQFLPVTPVAAPVSPSAAVETEVHLLALAFAAAAADGTFAAAPSELVPRYAQEISGSATQLGWSRDNYTLRSKPVDAELCASVNGSSAPYAAEQAQSGLQCYLDALGARRLAYRLEPIDAADRKWQQVDASLRMLGNVPVVSLRASKTLLDECVPAPAPTSIPTARTEPVSATETLCLPAWAWEGADTDQGAVLRDTPTELVWSLRSGGQLHEVRVRAQMSGPRLEWSVTTGGDDPPAAS